MIILAGNALVAPVLAGNSGDAPCLSRWGRELPPWVCDLAGHDTRQWVPTLGAVAVAVLLGFATWVILRGVEEAGSFRNWWDSLR